MPKLITQADLAALLAANVKARRRHLKMTVAQAAELAGLTVGAWRKIEAARANPAMDKLVAIAGALQVDPVSLFRRGA